MENATPDDLHVLLARMAAAYTETSIAANANVRSVIESFTSLLLPLDLHGYSLKSYSRRLALDGPWLAITEDTSSMYVINLDTGALRIYRSPLKKQHDRILIPVGFNPEKTRVAARDTNSSCLFEFDLTCPPGKPTIVSSLLHETHIGFPFGSLNTMRLMRYQTAIYNGEFLVAVSDGPLSVWKDAQMRQRYDKISVYNDDVRMYISFHWVARVIQNTLFQLFKAPFTEKPVSIPLTLFNGKEYNDIENVVFSPLGTHMVVFTIETITLFNLETMTIAYQGSVFNYHFDVVDIKIMAVYQHSCQFLTEKTIMLHCGLKVVIFPHRYLCTFPFQINDVVVDQQRVLLCTGRDDFYWFDWKRLRGNVNI